MYNLQRFKDAQEKDYSKALEEMIRGRKTSHWIWYIFPQLKGLGRSETANYYGLKNKAEAAAYLDDPILGKRLIEISEAILQHSGKTALEIMGSPDDLKLNSCMTLFGSLPDCPPVFRSVLKQFFNGEKDTKTTELLSANTGDI